MDEREQEKYRAKQIEEIEAQARVAFHAAFGDRNAWRKEVMRLWVMSIIALTVDEVMFGNVCKSPAELMTEINREQCR